MTQESATVDPPGDELFARVPTEVSVYEVSPRDGLQNESTLISLEGKRRLINALVAAGLRRIEVTSFVSPKWVPQLADAEELARVLRAPEGITFSALCPNARGLERALSAGLSEIAVFLSASEAHNKANINKTIADTLAVFSEIVPPAREAGLLVRAYVSTVWGCPYEGAVDPARVVKIAEKLLDLGCYQISLGDTIGVGNPRQTREIVRRFLDVMPPERFALHMHDTRGTALANVLTALEMGVRDFDASVGGVGGCPYAPGAAGNLATEDLVFMLQSMGISTGIDLDKLIEAGNVAEQVIGRALPGKVHKAGPFRLRRSPTRAS
ncbi:hydroxymethylglutaryl-CoA lyase [Chondromyces apiculatus]|uniref:Hydroxymethylglutaryl-CoA lyase n=1 Tax=Chondromyces apiculatus DSM 436 TaxID=1192034 RepID=A0A017TH49_9BACT|nr:hydroxymethylglutaryl-CoA lyase [Chondromyces apiculatus]EYF07946.1 Hydroxymethylglutaryl-CoA lyase [Chondromyces apiculatus DSM 436]